MVQLMQRNDLRQNKATYIYFCIPLMSVLPTEFSYAFYLVELGLWDLSDIQLPWSKFE